MSRSSAAAAWELSWLIAGCRHLGQAEIVAGQWLLARIGGDYCGYNHVQLSARPVARARIYPDDDRGSAIGPALTRHLRRIEGVDHPVVNRYLEHPDDFAPVRMSDLVSDRQLVRTAAFGEVLNLIGARRLLAFPTVARRRAEVGGYVIIRSGSDFPDSAVDLAYAVQPVMAAVQRLLPADLLVVPEAAGRHGLTDAEADVLAHLAAGLTAQSIARVRRVSPRTVRKQLDNIYRKLGIHDRLQAVTYAQRVGLVVSGARPPAGGPS
jgi:DNA-binding CsgD family transcriptional regulator